MASDTMRIFAAVIMVIALAGCEQASAPPGTPGAVTFSLHGRIETGASVSTH